MARTDALAFSAHSSRPPGSSSLRFPGFIATNQSTYNRWSTRLRPFALGGSNFKITGSIRSHRSSGISHIVGRVALFPIIHHHKTFPYPKQTLDPFPLSRQFYFEIVTWYSPGWQNKGGHQLRPVGPKTSKVTAATNQPFLPTNLPKRTSNGARMFMSPHLTFSAVVSLRHTR